MLNSSPEDLLAWNSIFWGDKNDHAGCHFGALFELWLQCAAEEVWQQLLQPEASDLGSDIWILRGWCELGLSSSKHPWISMGGN